jgi:multidrug efflux system membrane fusion protein
MHGRQWRLGVVMAIAALAACGGKQAPPAPPRPALVVQPGGGPDLAFDAFAGEVRARNENPLSFRIGGNLARRLVDAGDRVRHGQLLAELDPGDQRLQAGAAQAQVAAAEAALVRARADLDRYKALADQQLVSRSTYDAQLAAYRAAEGQARAARAQAGVAGNQAGYTQLRAPRDGVIASRMAEAGQTVAAGQAIYVLAGDAGREVQIALPEARIRDFQVGQPALVELWGRAGERLPARIREIAPAADPQVRTYAARVALEPAAAAAVDLGQSARVYVQQAGPAAALRIPLSALQRDEAGRASVWVVAPGTHALRRAPVTLGPFGADSVPVLSGVAASDWIVAAGGHLLREGQVVAPVDRDNRPVGAAPGAR